MKFLCPRCKQVSTHEKIDRIGKIRWHRSYTSIVDCRPDSDQHPYICPQCHEEPVRSIWSEATYLLPEDLFTI